MNPIPGPLLLLALPLLAGALSYLVRRWATLAALVASATTGALALLCASLPLDRSAFVLGQEVAFGRPVVILGRNLVLDPAGQAWLTLVFALAAICYLFAWRISQGRSFFPLSLVILSLYTAIALLHNLPLAIITFALSATLAVFIIQAGQPGSIRGAQRYLVVTVLAVPLLLAAVWLADQSQLDANSAELVRHSFAPAALGFGLLLAAFPFGTWMPALAADAPPLVTAFFFASGQTMALYLALLFFQHTPLSLGDPAVQTVVQFAGLVMAVTGGIVAAAQRDFGRLFGYAALSDLGYLLLALGLGSSQGLVLGLLHMANRATAILLAAAALAVLRHRATTDRYAGLAGIARRLPVVTTGLMIGGLALAGFPLTAGFATHWAVYRAVMGEESLWALLLLLSSAGIVVGLLRGLSATLAGESPDSGDDPRLARQPRLAALMILALAALVVVLGVYPQLFLGPVEKAVQALSLF